MRPFGLYRNLADEGWSPTVLTASAGHELPGVVRVPHHRVRDRFDAVVEIGRKAPSSVTSAMRFLRRLLAEASAHPDAESGWRNAAVECGLAILAEGGFSAIVSTSPPATTHLVALQLKQRTGVPWVADLRDLWADNYAYPWSSLRRTYDRRIERRVLKQADAVVSVSEPLAAVLRAQHPLPVHSIPNGFPKEEMLTPLPELTREFSISYTGTLYPGKRDPLPLLEALRGLIANGRIDPVTLRIRFYGRNVEHDWLRSLIAASQLVPCTILGGLLPRAEVLQRQRESQILLALDWTDENQPGVFTEKIFEYLAARRPILSLGPSGSVVDMLLRETGAGVHCSTTASVSEFLEQSYGQFLRDRAVSYSGRAEATSRYDHGAMCRRFADVLNPLPARARLGSHDDTGNGRPDPLRERAST
jgi:glycosyltransferase involved in cell wall biosynthesis